MLLQATDTSLSLRHGFNHSMFSSTVEKHLRKEKQEVGVKDPCACVKSLRAKANSVFPFLQSDRVLHRAEEYFLKSSCRDVLGGPAGIRTHHQSSSQAGQFQFPRFEAPATLSVTCSSFTQILLAEAAPR